MSDLVYRIRPDEELHHAYTSSYTNNSKSTYNPVKRAERYQATKPMLARKSARTKNPYGNYKSPYYDPVKRHEYYEAHKTHATRPYGIGGSGSGSKGKGGSGGKGGGSGGKGGGSGGKGKGGKSKGSSTANLSDEIKALREESAINTDAQREATKRKIADLRSQLEAHTQQLKNTSSPDAEEGVNVSEIRGRVQSIKDQIEKEGGDLQKWISQEKDALERRIAAVYKSKGKEYTVKTQADRKDASEKRKTEVNSRADSIYKRKS